MHCLQLKILIEIDHILQKQNFVTNGIPAYISDGGIRSHYRAFQRVYPSSLFNYIA